MSANSPYSCGHCGESGELTFRDGTLPEYCPHCGLDGYGVPAGELRKDDDKAGLLLIAVNAIAHFIEHADTHESTDIHAAMALLKDETVGLKKWIEENGVLVPLRRDGRSLVERIEDYR